MRPFCALHCSWDTCTEVSKGKQLLPSSISHFQRTFNLPFCGCPVDTLAPHPLPFICGALIVYCPVEADLFHRLLCVIPQKEGFEICEHEALGLALLPQLALSLHNHATLTAQMLPVLEWTSYQGPHVGEPIVLGGCPPKPSTKVHWSCVP